MIHESELMVNDIVEYTDEGIACFCRIKGIGDGLVLLRTLKDKGEYVATFDDIRPVALSKNFFHVNNFLHGYNAGKNTEMFNLSRPFKNSIQVWFYKHELGNIEIWGESHLETNTMKYIHAFQNALRSCGLKDIADNLIL